MAHLWTPQDLPADFKLGWYHFPDSSTVTLDANGKIASIENKFDNGSRPCATADATKRHLLQKFNGFDTAFSDTTNYGGILMTNTTGLPVGNADLCMVFVQMPQDGVVGGYRGGNNYWVDNPFPDYRMRTNAGDYTLTGNTNNTTLHTLIVNRKSGTSTFRVDGTARGSQTPSGGYNTTLGTFGIKGADAAYYVQKGSSLGAIVGKRAATADEMYLIEKWYSTFTGQTVQADNPYVNGLPMVADGGTTVGGTGTAAGTGAALATGSSQATGTGSTTGTGTATAVGTATAAALGVAAGVGTATGAGGALSGGVGSAVGTGTAQAAGIARASGTGAATGFGSALATGSALVSGTGTASGGSTATGTSGSQVVIGATGTSLGGSTVLATGQALAGGTGTATGAATATSTSGQVTGGTGSATGTALVSASGAARVSGQGAARGSAIAAAVVTSRVGVLGVAVGTGRAFAYGTRLQILARPPASRTARSIVRYRVAVDPVRGRRAR